MSKLLDISNIDMPSELPKIPFYKDPKSYEIACSLFEACNLKCKFCFEGHRNNKIDLNYIRNIPFEVMKAVRKDFKQYPNIQEVNVRLWGGELFFDGLPDSLFQEYKNFVDTFNNLFKTEFPKITLKYSWLTNGVFTKRDRVLDILKYSNGTIGFSYDPSGRFSSEKQKELMISNVKYFHEMKCFNCLSITLTKKTIEEYVSGKSDLDRLDFNERYDINFYTANPNWKELLPNDDDLFTFFKWGLDNDLYYINVISNLVNTTINEGIYIPQHYCDCKTCVQYSNGQATVDCVKRASILPAEMFYGKYADIINEENVSDIKLSLGMMKRGCLNCEYYKTCQMPCWVSVVFEGFTPTDCPYKRAHKYIEENPEIKERYKKWIQKNPYNSQ